MAIQFIKDVNVNADLTAIRLIKNGGVSTQFLKADGSVDNNIYLTSEDLPSTLDLFATTTASDIPGYVVLVRNITDSRFNTIPVNVSTGVITTTAQLVGSLISDANIISGNPGIFNITTLGNISRTAGTGEAEFFFRVYKRSNLGVETFITESSKTLPVTNGGYTEFSATALWNNGIFLDTDRIVLKYYADRLTNPVGSNPTYNFQFGGTSPVRSIAAVPVAVLPNIYLKDLADVEDTDALNNEILYWNSTSNLWEHSYVINLLSPASSTVNGYLSSTDWITFNSKANASGTTNYVSKFTGASTLGNSLIFDNGTNVGIGTTNPTSAKLVLNSGTSNQNALINGDKIGFTRTSDAAEVVYFKKDTSLGTEGTANINGYDGIQFRTQGAESVKAVISSTGNVGIGTTSPSGKLTISGIDAGCTIDMFNTGISQKYRLVVNTSSGALAFENNSGSETIRFNQNGNVGIGTTSPSSKLHVVGEGVFDDGTNGRLTFGNASGQNDIYSTTTAFGGWKNLRLSSNELILSTGGTTERMRITSGGNVGIGTTSPTSRLQVDGQGRFYTGSSSVAGVIVNGAGGVGTTSQGVLQFGDTNTNFQIQAGDDYVGMLFKVGAERMRITSAGNVGIGTSSPSEKLEVQNGTAGAKIKVSNSGGGSASLEISSNASSVAQLNFTNQLSLIGGNVGIGTTSPFRTLDINGNLRVQSGTIDLGNSTNEQIWSSLNNINFKTNGSEKVIITSSGNVGIGLTDPIAKLEVYESARVRNPSNANERLNFGWTNLNTVAYIDAYNFSTGTRPSLALQPEGGNVGIGTTSPAAKLDVAGDALINGVTVGAGPSNIVTNTVVGFIAGSSLTTGAENIFIGKYSGSIATDCNNSTVIGGYLSPSKIGFNESDTLSIEKPDSELNGYIGESAGLPHIWSPKTIVITDTSNAVLVRMKCILYSSIFMEYNLEDTNGNMRAGSIKAIWNADASTIKVTEETTDSIGITSGCVIELVQDGADEIIVRFINTNGFDTYCNTTSRILIRPTIQIL